MGTSDPIITSFSSGELSKMLNGRVDFNKYRSGLDTLVNMIALPQGPVQKRPGFRMVAETECEDRSGADYKSRLIPFVFSSTQSYMLEFGWNVIRFYYEGAQILDESGVTPFEVAIPYDEEEIWEIDYAQSADTMYITHGHFRPMMLKRQAADGTQALDHYDWVLETYTWKNGPVRPELLAGESLDDKYWLEPSGIEGDITFSLYETETSTSAVWFLKPGDRNSVWKVRHNANTAMDAVTGNISAEALVEESGSFAGDGTGSQIILPRDTDFWVVVTLAGTWSGRVKYVMSSPDDYDDVPPMWRTKQDWTANTPTGGWQQEYAMRWAGSNGKTDWHIRLAAASWASGSCDWELKVYDELHTSAISVPSGYEYVITLDRDDAVYTGVTGKIDLERSWDGGNNWELQQTFDSDEGDFPVDETFTNDFTQAIQVRLKSNVLVTGDVNYSIAVKKPKRGYGYITLGDDAFMSVGIARATVESYEDEDGETVGLVSTDRTQFWSASEWSYFQFDDLKFYDSQYSSFYYPQKVCFFEDRLVFANNASNPNTIWMSKSGDFTDFWEGPDDDDAITIRMNSDTVDEIQWLHGGNTLMVGTSGGIWRVGAANPNEAVTPSNVSARLHVRIGCSSIKPVRAAHALLFINKTNRKLYELKMEDENVGFVADELTLLADHVGKSGFTDLTFQETPHSIVWITRSDGVLLSMTYQPEHEVFAWARHTTPDSGVFEAVGCVPRGNFDELYTCVQRERWHPAGPQDIDIRYIEKMDEFVESHDETLNERIMLDEAYCNFESEGESPISSVVCTNLRTVDGTTVYAIGDGEYIGSWTVDAANPTIDLGGTYTDVIVGRMYTAELKTLRIDNGDLQNTNQGRRKDIAQVVVRVFQTLGGHIGGDESITDPLYEGTTMKTGDIVIDQMREGLGRDGQIYIKHDTPQPFTLTALMPRMKVNDN